MKKALVTFIISYAIVFYFINEKYLAVASPENSLSSQTDSFPLIKVRNDQQLNARMEDTIYLNNPESHNLSLKQNVSSFNKKNEKFLKTPNLFN